MSKSNLTKQKSNIKNIFDKGNKFVSKTFIAFYIPADSFSSTVIASKKVGNAVKRNFCKRRLRELSKLYIQQNITPIKLILLGRARTSLTNFSELIKDCNSFIKNFK